MSRLSNEMLRQDIPKFKPQSKLEYTLFIYQVLNFAVIAIDQWFLKCGLRPLRVPGNPFKGVCEVKLFFCNIKTLFAFVFSFPGHMKYAL